MWSRMWQQSGRRLRFLPLLSKDGSHLFSRGPDVMLTSHFCAVQSRTLLNPASVDRPLQPSVRHSSNLSKDVDFSKYVLHDPEKGDLVYVGTLSSLIKGVKIFSLSTSAAGIGMQPVLFQNMAKLPAAIKYATIGSMGFMVILTPLMLHWLTGRYVTQMYYNKDTDKFTVTTYTLFCTKKDREFTASSVHVPDIPGLLTTVKVQNKALFFEPDLFLDRNAYIKMMGYDKPMDWNMPDDIKRLDEQNKN